MGKRLDDGTWEDSCLKKVQPGEPIFVLRAQDLFAPVLVRLWADMAATMTSCPSEKVSEAIDCAQAMEEWPHRKFPD